MKVRQIVRKRPSIQAAHQYRKSGLYYIDPQEHFLSGDKREAELKTISDSLLAIVKNQFPRTQNLEFAILKAHLIIEYAIVQYIRGYAAVIMDHDKLDYKFSQKLEIAYLLGFGAQDPILLPTVELINNLRNKIAHKFDFNKSILDEMLFINGCEKSELVKIDDRGRIKYLRRICSFVCARVAVEMQGAYEIAVLIEDEFKAAKPKRTI